MTDNSLLFKEEYEEDYEDIVSLVINSLKIHSVDYCYSRKDLINILKEAKRQNLSMYYKEYLEKDGTLDYFKIVPARFYSYNSDGQFLLHGECHNYDEIPLNYKCVITKRGHAYTIKKFDEPVKEYNKFS